MEYPQFPTVLVVGLLLATGTLIGTGCSPGESSSPEIADTTLVPLLAELHLARARQNIEQDVPPSIRDSIFQRFDTDSASLARTLSYYMKHPEKYQQIYDEVAFHLQEQRRDTTTRPETSRARSRAQP